MISARCATAKGPLGAVEPRESDFVAHLGSRRRGAAATTGQAMAVGAEDAVVGGHAGAFNNPPCRVGETEHYYPVEDDDEDDGGVGRLLRRCWRYGMPRCTAR
jgi:hypothetical protein